MARAVFWLIGGALCAMGVINLFYSFGAPYGGEDQLMGGISTALDKAGWDALGDIGTTSRTIISVVCLGLGIPLLMGLNATAWKETGGY